MIIVKFAKTSKVVGRTGQCHVYNAGETAGFEDGVAQRLLDGGVATEVSRRPDRAKRAHHPATESAEAAPAVEFR